MLRQIAVFSMQNPLYAAGTVVLLSLAALVLPPVNYIASGIIVLYTLRMGPQQGIKVMSVSIVLFAIVTSLLLDKALTLSMLLLLSWLLVWAASLVLGYTRSLAASLLATGIFGIVLVVGIYLFVPEPELWWQQLITQFLGGMNERTGGQFDLVAMQQKIVVLSKMMTGWLAASVVINIVIALLIGRSLQAKLYNPGSFAGEFQQLKLGKTAAMIAVGLLLITLLPAASQLTILQQCLPPILVLFVLQGLAVAHAIVNQQQKSTYWLVALYVLLIIMLPQMVIVLALTGILEQWFNFRRRY